MQKIINLINVLNTLIPALVIFSLSVALAAVAISIKRDLNAKRTQLKKRFLKSRVNGIIFGKKSGKYVFSETKNEGHVAAFGGSGVGKTSSILIPSLRSWAGTSFVIDVAGDISKNVDIQNKLVYRPGNPENSIPYNIFGPIDSVAENEDIRNEMLEALAYLLMPDNEADSDAGRFYSNEGRRIITASLISFYHIGYDFVEICEEIIRSDWKTLFTKIDNTHYLPAIQYINSFQGTNEANTAGCKQAADLCIKLFATNRIKENIRRPSSQEEAAFTPSILETHSVFVAVDDSKLALYAPLLNIITSQVLQYLSDRPSSRTSPVLLCLDEFSSLGRFADITDGLRKLRKKHVRIMILTQSLADLDLVYGRDTRTAMMGNLSFKIILQAADSDTQKYFADLIGYQDATRQYIIEPAELGRLTKNNELILIHPDGYARLRKNFYFRRFFKV